MTDLTKEVTFRPTQRMKEAKVRLRRALEHRWQTASQLTMPQLIKLSGTHSVEKWTREEGFLSWFFDEDTPRVKLQSLAEGAVRQLEKMIAMTVDGEKMKASDKLRAIDMVLKYSGLEPPKKIETKEEKSLPSGEELDQYMKEQVKEYISKLTPSEKVDLLGVKDAKVSDSADDES